MGKINKYLQDLTVIIILLILIIITIIKSQGINWPDEIYQTVEPAFRLITGKGIVAWEFEEKVRSMLYPFLISLWMRLFFLFTNSAIIFYYSFRVLLGLLFLIMGFLFYKSTLKFAQDNSTQKILWLLFVVFWITFPVSYYFGFVTLTESITTSLSLIGIFLLLFYLDNLKKYQIFIIMVVIGLTYGIRFQVGIFYLFFFPCYFFWLYQKRKLKQYLTVIIMGGLAGLLIYGLVDYIFYGLPFVSSYEYFDHNIIQDVASGWGTSPFYYYLKVLIEYYSFFIIFAIYGMVYYFKKLYPLTIALMGFILIHSIIGHKEIRFIYFLLPLISFFVCLGIYQFVKLFSEKKILSITLMIIICLWGLALNWEVTKNDVPWDLNHVNLQAFLGVSDKNLRGNTVIGVSDYFAWGAGYVYLGKNFDGELFFKNLELLNSKAVRNYLVENKINNILIYEHRENEFCKDFGYCSVLLKTDNLIWLKN